MTEPTVSPASPPRSSDPPTAMDPSPVVRGLRETRELATDLGGMALAAYFVQHHAVSAQLALAFVLVLVLPSSVLTRYAKILLARGGSNAAALAIVGVAGAWTQLKWVTVSLGYLLTITA